MKELSFNEVAHVSGAGIYIELFGRPLPEIISVSAGAVVGMELALLVPSVFPALGFSICGGIIGGMIGSILFNASEISYFVLKEITSE